MKKTVVSRRTAALVLQRHFGNKPEAIRRIHGGLANHVFEARAGKEELILRISEKPEKLQVFMKEQWAVNAARKNKVPTPEMPADSMGGSVNMISKSAFESTKRVFNYRVYTVGRKGFMDLDRSAGPAEGWRWRHFSG